MLLAAQPSMGKDRLAEAELKVSTLMPYKLRMYDGAHTCNNTEMQKKLCQ